MRKVVAAAIGVAALVGVGMVNMSPAEYAPINTTYQNTANKNMVGSFSPEIICSGVVFKHCNVYMPNTDMHGAEDIGAPAAFTNFINLLNAASMLTSITVYSQGNGGRMDSMFLLVRAVQHTKARVNVVVTGDSYSASAMFVAAFGKNVEVDDNTIIMFHKGWSEEWSRTDEKICEGMKGETDRGQDGYTKCLAYAKKLRPEVNILPDAVTHLLTKEELENVLAGYDLFMSGKVYKERVNGNFSSTVDYAPEKR